MNSEPPAVIVPVLTSPADAGTRRTSGLVIVARVTGAVLLALGVTICLAWYVQLATILQIRPGLAPMQFNTAIGFSLLGCSLLFATLDARLPALLAASLCALLSVVTLLQYPFSRNFGIDELFFKSFLQDATSPSGRMSPITALALTFAALAAILLTSPQRFARQTAIAAGCALLVGVLGFTAVIGYIADIPGAYGWGNFTQVALHTAVGLVVLTAGLIALAWYAARRHGEVSPRWLWPAALAGGLIASYVIAHALAAAGFDAKNSSHARTFIPELIFVFGAVLSLMLARAVHLTQLGVRQRAELEMLMRMREQASMEAARAAAIVMSSDDAIISVDLESRVLTWNHGAEIIFGYPAATMLGQPLAPLVPADLGEEHCDLMSKIRQGQGVRQYETRRQHQDGSQIEVAMTVSPIRDESGVVVGAATVARNIGKRRRNELALRESLVEKEALLKEVHHRVKNNMQVMASILGLQAYLIDEPRYREKFDACRDRIRTMATVHDRLYRNDSLVSIEFASMVRDLTTMVYRSRTQTDCAIELAFDLDPVTLDVDTAMPACLVVHELVANAIRHAFVGRDQGSVRTSLKRLASDRIEFAVCDDGVGGVVIGDAVAASPTLGMKIVRDLVRQLDGTLSVSAENGSTLRVVFPDPLAKAA